ILRAQSSFFAKRALRIEKSALAIASRGAADCVADAHGRVSEHAGFREAVRSGERGRQPGRADFQFFFSSRLAQRRERQWRWLCFRWAELAESRARGTIQGADRQRCSGYRLSESAGERASVFGQRAVAGGCQRGELQGAWVQEFDGVLWMYRRAAPVGVPGGTVGEAFTREEWD